MRATLMGIGLALLLPAGTGLAQEAVKPVAGLYLRGEVGYFWSRPAGIGDRAAWNGPNCLICTGGDLDDVGNGGMVGGGLGWRFNDWLRAEATVTYRGGLQLKDSDGSGFSYRSNIHSTAGMLSLLVDAPWRLGPLQPFAGGGIGVAHNSMGRISQSGSFAGLPVSESDPSGSSTGFAWQATLGLAWPILPNLTAELAYRYVDLGKLKTSAGNSQFTVGTTTVAVPTGGVEGNLRGQEALLALRWSF
jgi:opacity protein-like surface antigen